MSIIKKHFGFLPDGRKVSSFTLENAAGMKVKLSDFGGTILEILTPDREGRFTDIVCGYSCLSDYINASGYQGALIGRVGNRICKGKFTLEGKEYSLFINNGVNSLHGGRIGFSHKLWSAEPIDGDEPRLVLEYTSPDMEEGYPGTLSVKVTYTLTRDNALSIRYEAETDKTTIVNLTNHVYFNLAGFAAGSIEDHMLWMDADTYNPTDETLIPTGEVKSVVGTPFDFTSEKEIGRDIDADDPDLRYGAGYDINFNFRGGETEEPTLRAKIFDPKTGRELSVLTNQPSVQLYTGNMMNGEHRFKGGYPQSVRHAFAFETQKMPDAVNHSNFTSTVLAPGEKYDYTTVYKFCVREK